MIGRIGYIGYIGRRTPRPDFLRPARRPGRLAWAACATTLAVLAVAALEAHGAWAARQAATGRLARAERAASATGPIAAAPPQRPSSAAGAAATATATATAADRRQADARQWLLRLARPWPAVWAAGEVAALDGIRWLGLDLGERGQLRLDGLAPDATQVLDAAQALRAQPQAGGTAVWRDVVVARIDRTPEGQRFEISAQLAGGGPRPAALPSAPPAAPPAAPSAARTTPPEPAR